MSLTIQTILSCDECGKTFANGDASHLTGKEQRKEASERNGWTKIGSKDLCGVCKNERNELNRK